MSEEQKTNEGKTAQAVDLQTYVSKHSVFNMIDCEIDCIQSGNRLTPFIKSLVIKALNNVKKRMSDC